MWNLTPQPVRSEYRIIVHELIEREKYKEVREEYFETFEKGKHITWQQWLILLAVEKAVKKEGKGKISISSGHGIGKSVVLAWLILWYLFCYKNAQVPCTAPTTEQMHDILWKELANWHSKMPKKYKDIYEWSNDYMRVLESPKTWFARAKTARKEKPEALAGIHGDYVMFLVDEASGVPDEIFNTAEGAMTGPNVLVIMISNPTRLIGYFYDSHHSDSESWVNMQFDSNDSPIVEKDYVQRIIEKHGEESDEYLIRVTGAFPAADAVDDQGYVPLFLESDIRFTEAAKFIGDGVMGIDPSGEGRDETIWVIRDRFRSQVVAKENISTAKSIAEKTINLMEFYGVRSENVYVDNFGTGANVAQEMAISGFRINGINVGEKAYDPRFFNLRAQAYWNSKEWVRTGGEFVSHDGFKELLYIRYKNTLSGKLQVMPKLDMKKKLGKSPDHADAFMLTFISPAKGHVQKTMKKIRREQRKKTYSLKMA